MTPAPVVPDTGEEIRGLHLPESVRSRTTRAMDLASNLGSIITLAALVVLGTTAAGGLVDSAPAGADATLTVTYDGGR